MKKLLIAAALVCALWPKLAPAQNAITQNGSVLQNSPMMFNGDHKARQGATASGAGHGKIVTTGDSVVGGRCDYSVPTDDPSGYTWVCLDAKNNAIRIGGSNVQNGFSVEVDGTRYSFPQSVAIVGSDAVVASNAALKTVPGATGKRLGRLGFTTIGDGGSATYNWSSSNCAAPDDGAQVQPTAITGCWVADLSSMKPTPMIWGAKGDGTTNDTTKVQAAVDALQNSTLYLGRHRYCIGSPGIQVTHPMTIVGEGPTALSDTTKYGFTACAKEIPIITFGSGGGFASNGSRMQDVYIDASTAGPNLTANSKGVVMDFASWVTIDHVKINKACIGIDETIGNSNSVRNTFVTSEGVQMAAPCLGIRVGHSSSGAQETDFRLHHTSVDAFVTASVWVEDAGGMFITDSDFLYAKNGLVISPNANQFVLWMFANNTALSDTTCNSGLLINATTPTSHAEGLSFTNTWTSSSGSNPATGCTGNGVFIENTGGGTVKGIEFTSHRSINNSQAGMLINSNVFNVNINGGMYCNNSVESITTPANIYNGITLGANVSSVSIHNAMVSGDCFAGGGNTGLQGTGIFLAGSNADLSITNNFLRANAVAPMSYAGAAPINNVVIKDNLANDNVVNNIADAATISLPLQPITAITGTGTSITTVNNMWDAREAYLYMRDGSITLATGGNLCSGGVFPAQTTAILRKIPGASCIAVK